MVILTSQLIPSKAREIIRVWCNLRAKAAYEYVKLSTELALELRIFLNEHLYD